jgi:peptide/nickel transport system substrate-binding protein
MRIAIPDVNGAVSAGQGRAAMANGISAARHAPRRLALALGLALATMGPALPAWAKERIVIDQVNEPASMDPHRQWNPDSYYVYRNIFDNLLSRDAEGKIIPHVATSWRYVNETEVEFTLREGITFHDGRALTPEDVVFSVRRIIDPAFASPQLGQFNQITAAEVTGPHTVKLTTAGPSPVLLAQLVKLSIVPKHVVEAVGNDAFNAAPVGSGPYRFQQWQRGAAVTLARNDAYWGAKGPFATAVFRAVPDAATRLADLQAGTADIVTTLDTDQAAQLQGSRSARPLFVLSERVAYLGLNVTRAPLNDVRVRRAIAAAIDKEGIIEGILGGHAEPAAELVTPIHVGYSAGITAPAFDEARATALVREAGARQTLDLATGPAYDQRVVQAIQQMLTGAGLQVEVRMSDMATLIQSIRQGPETMPALNYGTWSCTCQDADGVLYSLLHSSSGWSSLRDPQVDAALDAARRTLDTAERERQYRIVHQYVADQVPLVPLYRVALVFGAANGLQWTPTPDQSLYLNRMSWKD